MRLNGTDRRRITGGPQGANDPNVSPDGRKLNFVGSREGVEFAQALFTVRLDGTSVKRLTPFLRRRHQAGLGARRRPTPVHRERRLRPPGASANMATIRPDGTGFRYLTRYSGGEVNAFAGSYSPNGRRIVFRYEDHGNYGLYTMRPDGCHVRVILPLSEFRPRYIDWGPETGHRR